MIYKNFNLGFIFLFVSVIVRAEFFKDNTDDFIPDFIYPIIDQAQILEPEKVNVLNKKLFDLNQAGGPQIAVLTLPSLGTSSIEERAVQVFEKWKTGGNGKDNGVLFLVADKERKIRIEVGYGLEGRITDLVAKRIIENDILPRFRTGDISAGIVAGVEKVASVSGFPIIIINSTQLSEEGAWAIGIGFILFILYLFFFGDWGGRRRDSESSSRSWGGGGGRSGGGGASGSW